VVGKRSCVFARIAAAAVLLTSIAGPLHGAALASDTVGSIGGHADLRADPVADQATQPRPRASPTPPRM
jgi:hypothetical protein